MNVGEASAIPVEGRAAVVTGAAGGIGRALALVAAEHGMACALIDVDERGLAETADAVRTLGVEVLAERVDVRSRAEQAAFAERVASRFGSIALVFANAGVLRAGTSWLMSAEDWDLVIDVNLKGVVHAAGVFVPRLLAQAEPARFVITGSTSGFSARAGNAAYSSTKHALWALAEAMQLELRAQETPIGVTLLAPSAVRTQLAAMPGAGPGAELQQALQNALDKLGSDPAEIASAAFEAARARRFWVLPHPQCKDELRARVERVIAELEPGA